MNRGITVVLFLLGGILQANAQQGVCIDEEELALANQINQFRKQNDLKVLPVSTALSYVADVHVKDLYLHHDPFGDCNLLSWSGNGRWEKCCAQGENYSCMYDKPAELTEYEGRGYELVYFQNTQVTSGLAFNAWKENASAKTMLLQQGQHEDKDWQAIGVAIFDGYASIWLGEKTDERGEPPLCSELEQHSNKQQNVDNSNQKNENVPEYFVIVGSHRKEDEAMNDQEKLAKRHPVMVLQNESNFRVAVGPVQGYSKAQKVKAELSAKYPQAWILKAEPKH